MKKEKLLSQEKIKEIIQKLPFEIIPPQKYNDCFLEKIGKSEKNSPKIPMNKYEKSIVIILDQISKEIFYYSKKYSENEIKIMLNTYRFLRKVLFINIVQRLKLNLNETYCISYRENFQIIINSPFVKNWAQGEDNDFILWQELIPSWKTIPSSNFIN